MDNYNFQQIFQWVIGHGYFIIFIAMCVEGPVTTAASGFASALGYFDPWVIFFISLMGDLVPDTIYYFIGWFSQASFLSRAENYFGISQERKQKIEDLLKRNFRKTMIALKLAPFLPMPAFMLVGYLKFSFWKFTKYSAAVTVPKALIFLLIGYFFGQMYGINQYVRYAEIFILLSAIIIFAIYFGYKKIAEFLARRIENI